MYTAPGPMRVDMCIEGGSRPSGMRHSQAAGGCCVARRLGVGCQCRLNVTVFPVVTESVFEVPVDGGLETLLPHRLLSPAQPCKLLIADEVPLVVEGTVLHVHNLVIAELEDLGNLASDLLDGALLLGTDVVYLADGALVKHDVEGLSNVLHEQEGPVGAAIAVNGQVLPAAGPQRKLGDKLLRELVGPVHVVAAGDDAGQLVRGHVCLHHHLCARLGGGVGVGGLQGSRLVEAHLCTHAGLTVHLVCADVDESLDLAVHAGGLKQHVRAVGVVQRECQTVPEGVVHVCLGCKVHNGVNLFCLQYVADEVCALDVCLHKLEVRVIPALVQVVLGRAVVQLVHNDDLVVWVLSAEPDANVRGNESGAACDQDTLGLVVLRMHTICDPITLVSAI
mmetsp:Transcript_10542/g.31745  ORF Transcript_10542/g.31745 Transcript_10542/m.31745 type:complete len:393 (-) Transcript_10542:95-1273(-)